MPATDQMVDSESLRIPIVDCPLKIVYRAILSLKGKYSLM